MISETIRNKASMLVREGKVEVDYVPEGVVSTVEGSGDMIHTPFMFFDGRRYCGCLGFWYSDDDMCSHVAATLESTRPDITKKRLYYALEYPKHMNEKYLNTTLDPWNELISPTKEASSGGIPRRSPVALAGKHEAGKTILSYQLIFEYLTGVGEGNAMIVDTEGSLDTYDIWEPIFESRYGITVNRVEINPYVNGDEVDWGDYAMDPGADHNIFVIDVRSLEDVLAIHGRPMKLITDDAKMKIAPNGEFKSALDSPIGKLVDARNVEAIVYDSISSPLEDFTNRQQDRPTRAKATNWWLRQAQVISQKMHTMQIYVTHLSKNPTRKGDRPKALGGKAVGHQTKYQIYLFNSKDSLRGLRLFRHPGRKPWEDVYWLDLQTGKGMVEADSSKTPDY